MKILLSCYRFLLFFIVSWTAYNTILFFYLMIPACPYTHYKDYLFGYANIYLLGTLDFPRFIGGLSELFHAILDILTFQSPFELVFPLLYCLLVNCTVFYAWCRRQNPFTAYGLAVAAWFVGPYTPIFFGDTQLWGRSFVATLIFYLLLIIANNYRRKHYPKLHLPPWLEWKHPDLLPPLEVIWERIASIFKKPDNTA